MDQHIRIVGESVLKLVATRRGTPDVVQDQGFGSASKEDGPSFALGGWR